MADHDAGELSCSEARDQPIEMTDAARRRALDHMIGCDACRVYFAERTCD